MYLHVVLQMNSKTKKSWFKQIMCNFQSTPLLSNPQSPTKMDETDLWNGVSYRNQQNTDGGNWLLGSTLSEGTTQITVKRGSTSPTPFSVFGDRGLLRLLSHTKLLGPPRPSFTPGSSVTDTDRDLNAWTGNDIVKNRVKESEQSLQRSWPLFCSLYGAVYFGLGTFFLRYQMFSFIKEESDNDYVYRKKRSRVFQKNHTKKKFRKYFPSSKWPREWDLYCNSLR